MGTAAVAIAALLAGTTIFVAVEVTPTIDGLMKLGVAGACLYILWWFLKQLITHGVIPFVKGTLESNAEITKTLQKTVVTMNALHESALETVKIVRRMSARLDEHMTADEQIDHAVLAELKKMTHSDKAA